MSNFSTSWLSHNFGKNRINFFDIGCADLSDTVNFKKSLPNAIFYAFECGDYWLENNLKISKKNNINYFHSAVTDIDGEVEFFPSSSHKDIPNWWFSGSTVKPTSNPHSLTWGEKYKVNSVRLDTFCKKNNVYPDILHIDVEGAEYKVLTCLGSFKPSCIWAEHSEFDYHDTKITYSDFYTLITEDLEYISYYKDGCDQLFVRSDLTLSSYRGFKKRKFNK